MKRDAESRGSELADRIMGAAGPGFSEEIAARKTWAWIRASGAGDFAAAIARSVAAMKTIVEYFRIVAPLKPREQAQTEYSSRSGRGLLNHNRSCLDSAAEVLSEGRSIEDVDLERQGGIRERGF